MKQASPTLEGFRTVFRQPSFALAEITWRWSVGVAAASLFAFATLEYLRTLPVTAGDLFFLSTRQPSLIYQAIQHIFRGSALRVAWATIILAASLGFAWMVVAALGRAVTVNGLLNYFRNHRLTTQGAEEFARPPLRLRSLMGLNFFRASATLAVVVGCVGAMVVAASASSKADPSPGSVVLIFFMLLFFVWLAWAILNWFFSLASIFVVSEGRDAFASLEAAVDMCRREPGSVFAAGTWFGLAHLTAFMVASSMVAFPLGFGRVLPGSVVVGGVLLVTLLYFATVDFLYAGRLAAYIAILELPDAPQPVTMIANLAPSSPSPSGSIDRDELILSDIPMASNLCGS